MTLFRLLVVLQAISPTSANRVTSDTIIASNGQHVMVKNEFTHAVSSLSVRPAGGGAESGTHVVEVTAGNISTSGSHEALETAMTAGEEVETSNISTSGSHEGLEAAMNAVKDAVPEAESGADVLEVEASEASNIRASNISTFEAAMNAGEEAVKNFLSLISQDENYTEDKTYTIDSWRKEKLEVKQSFQEVVRVMGPLSQCNAQVMQHLITKKPDIAGLMHEFNKHFPKERISYKQMKHQFMEKPSLVLEIDWTLAPMCNPIFKEQFGKETLPEFLPCWGITGASYPAGNHFEDFQIQHGTSGDDDYSEKLALWDTHYSVKLDMSDYDQQEFELLWDAQSFTSHVTFGGDIYRADVYT